MGNKRDELVLVDADQYFYQITSASQFEHCFDASTHSEAWALEADTYLASDVEAARLSLVSIFKKLKEDYDSLLLCFTSTPNFRHSCLPTYKGGRVKKRKPIGYWQLVQEFCDEPTWDTRKIPGLEADDVMSILATNPKYRKQYNITILSNDKDMRQVPDTLIITKDGPSASDLAAANHWRYTQALAGDPTDGYGGLAGYGKVKAEKALGDLLGQDEQLYIDTVMELYLEAGQKPAAAYAQMNCARILRYGEYDFKTKQPILLGD